MTATFVMMRGRVVGRVSSASVTARALIRVRFRTLVYHARGRQLERTCARMGSGARDIGTGDKEAGGDGGGDGAACADFVAAATTAAAAVAGGAG
jgi:hypothetical protein